MTTFILKYFQMKWLKRIGLGLLAIILLIALFAFISYQINKPKEISYSTVKEELSHSEIPVVLITTNQEIKNEPKVPAELIIMRKDSQLLKHNIGIEYRGKTSYIMSDKKSFAIEFLDSLGQEKEVAVLGMPKDEEWNLIGNVVMGMGGDIWDKTMLFNHIGYTLARKMDRYASRTEFVELVLNGKYMGLYTFGEKLKRGKNRIAISENRGDSTLTGGYIIAIDKAEPVTPDKKSNSDMDMSDQYKYTEASSFRSKYDINGKLITYPISKNDWNENKANEIYYNYVYPKPSNITTAQKKYIQDYVHQFEAAILSYDFAKPNRTYTNFIDLPSCVDYFLVNELCKNIDGYRLSAFMHKDRDGKLIMGPAWDMNIGFHEGNRLPDDAWVVDYNKHVQGDQWAMPFFWPRLMEDPQFITLAQSRWQGLRKEAFSDEQLLKIVDENANYIIKNNAVQRNYKKWDRRNKIVYESHVVSLRNFMLKRAAWMDKKLTK
jgi:hypothetical protein